MIITATAAAAAVRMFRDCLELRKQATFELSVLALGD